MHLQMKAGIIVLVKREKASSEIESNWPVLLLNQGIDSFKENSITEKYNQYHSRVIVNRHLEDNMRTTLNYTNVFLWNLAVTEIMHVNVLCRLKRQALRNTGEFWSQ